MKDCISCKHKEDYTTQRCEQCNWIYANWEWNGAERRVNYKTLDTPSARVRSQAEWKDIVKEFKELLKEHRHYG